MSYGDYLMIDLPCEECNWEYTPHKYGCCIRCISRRRDEQRDDERKSNEAAVLQELQGGS